MRYLQDIADKTAYMNGMVRLTKADGAVVDEERVFILNAAQGLGLATEQIADLDSRFTSPDKERVMFTNRGSAAFFIQEAIQLCMVDGQYDDNEKQEIRNIAEENGLNESDVTVFEEWIQEGLVWRSRGEALVQAIANRK